MWEFSSSLNATLIENLKKILKSKAGIYFYWWQFTSAVVVRPHYDNQDNILPMSVEKIIIPVLTDTSKHK